MNQFLRKSGDVPKPLGEDLKETNHHRPHQDVPFHQYRVVEQPEERSNHT